MSTKFLCVVVAVLLSSTEYFGVRAFGSTTHVARISAGIVYRFHRRD